MILDDLVTVGDVLVNDVRGNDDFGDQPIPDKLRLAVEDWLQPRLVQHGYLPLRHRTRRAATKAWASTGGAWVDHTTALAEPTDGTDLSAVLATPGTDALYIGLDRPFRGLFVSLIDTVNAQTAVASVTYWNGRWATLGSSLTDAAAVDGVPFAQAGRMYWPTPSDWMTRPVNASDALYWVRLQVNSPLSACLIHQLLPITRSRLTQPLALHALALLYREGIGSNRGEWKDKADAFEKFADAQLQLVIGQIADEFDVDNDGAVEATEVNSVLPSVWTWERG